MWIIPKQLHTSASALDTKALGLDSEEFSQICERSLTWRGKDSLSRTWLQRWKRENWMQHLCTRTLRPSLTGSFVDAWTSSLADSRVSHSVLPESVTALKIRDTSSLTSQTESESANLELFSSKTLKESSQPRQQTGNQFSNMSSESWKAWVIEQRREYSVRLKSAHLTRESGSSSWLGLQHRSTGLEEPRDGTEQRRRHGKAWEGCDTRDASGAHEEELANRNDERPQGRIRGGQDTQWQGVDGHAGCSSAGTYQRWPARPSEEQYEWEEPRVTQWPTPRANKVHPVITEENREQLANRKKANLEEEIAGHCGKAQGKLNPDWVEQSNGSSNRVDRLRLLGNGVVPATAAKAFVTLIQRLND